MKKDYAKLERLRQEKRKEQEEKEKQAIKKFIKLDGKEKHFLILYADKMEMYRVSSCGAIDNIITKYNPKINWEVVEKMGYTEVC